MNTYTLKEFSRLVNIPQETLKTWERSGKLSSIRNENGDKVYTDQHLFFCINNGMAKSHVRIKAYRVEIDLKTDQKIKLIKSLGTLRFVYNLFIDTNRQNYQNNLPYQDNFSFSLWLNNTYLPNNPDKAWIKETSSKAIKNIIGNAHQAYSKYFANVREFKEKLAKGQKVERNQAGEPVWPKPPKFKKKFVDEPSFYFIKDGIKVERHKIKIPIIGWVHIKEKGYIPRNCEPVSGTIKIQAGRFYLSLRVNEKISRQGFKPLTNGIGVDLGVKDTAMTSIRTKFLNINKSKKVRKLEKLLKRLDRKIARQRDDWKKRLKKREENQVDEKPTRNRLNRSYMKRQRIYAELTHIRDDYNNKIVAELVRTKPEYITIEDLNISGMMKNRHLSKAIASQKLYDLKTKLVRKCKETGIQVRMVSQWFPSSRTCHNCGYVKHDLKLKDRTFVCPVCGYSEDRDINAAMNLRNADKYTIAA